MRDLAPLQIRIGHTFRDATLLELALTHPSVLHETTAPRGRQHNQRLEFLGDAVLQLALTRELYDRFPETNEGPLTQARASLVNRGTLASLAAALDLGSHLRVSRGEEATGGRSRPSALADAFEAVVGAVFLDGGYEAARDFVRGQFARLTGEMNHTYSAMNPKGELQEWLQAISPHAPTYQAVSATGPDHDRIFECTVRHEGRELARGRGKSKKTAETEAAKAALEMLRAEKAGASGNAT